MRPNKATKPTNLDTLWDPAIAKRRPDDDT